MLRYNISTYIICVEKHVKMNTFFQTPTMGNGNSMEEDSEIKEAKTIILAERAQKEARKAGQELVIYFKQPEKDPNEPPPVKPPRDWMVLSCFVWFCLCNPVPGIIGFIFSCKYTKHNNELERYSVELIPPSLHLSPTFCLLSNTLVADEVSMLIYTCPHKPLGKIKVAICNHHAYNPFSLWPGVCFGICKFRKEYGHI